MTLLGIDAVRNNLNSAASSYADIQRQLDRYNKIFETYANASPETQMRAASVMRQALNEYNGLKKQQEENAMKIYEAQQWVDYYKENTPQGAQSPVKIPTMETASMFQPMTQTDTTPEQVPVITTSTPGMLNNNAPTTNVEVNAIDTNQTMNVPNPIGAPKSTINPTAPIGNQPKYPNTTIGPVTKRTTTTIKWPNYGPGSVVSTPGTGGYTTAINTYRTNNNALSNTLKNYVRKGARFLYNYLTR